MPQTIDNMIATWNNAGTTFTFLKANITDTASAAGSLLMDLQVGGSSRFNVSKAGTVLSAASGAGAAAFSAANFKLYSNTYFAVESGGGIAMTLERNVGTGLRVGSSMPIGWSSATDAWNNSPDLCLTRRAVANLRFGVADTGAVSATVTITIAAPGVVTWSSHGLSTGTPVVFTTTGALPTGITAGTTYYAVVVDANTIQLAASVANAIAATPTVITTSGSQSGTHTGTRYNITQRLSMQSVTGVADRLGADLIIQGSQGTGTGAGGSIVFQVAPAGSSGTAQNALATALTIDGAGRIQSNIFGYEVNNNTNTLFSVQGTALIQRAGSTIQFTTANYWQQLEFFTAATNRMTINPSGTVSIGGMTIDPSNGGITFLQTFGITMQTSNAFIIRHGNNDAFNIRPVSSGTPTLAFLDTLNAVRSALYGEAANTLALRNGANAQTFNVYNTYTDASNYERGVFQYSDRLYIGTQAAGTGVLNKNITFFRGATLLWSINASGHFVAETDNTYDIGASGASRPRHGYFGGNLVAGGSLGLQLGNTGAPIYWATRSQIYSPANGNIQLTNSSTNDFDRLQFGGTTSSFPALKRSSTTLQARLADDSAFASVQGKITTETAYTAGAPTATGYLVLYDSTGTAYRVPAVLN